MATSVRIDHVPDTLNRVSVCWLSAHIHRALLYTPPLRCQTFSLNASLIPFPSGTDHMISSLQDQEIDTLLVLLRDLWLHSVIRAMERGSN